MMNIGFISLDILILLILIVILIGFSFKSGKKLLTSLIISLYPSILIYQNLPFEFFNLNESSAKAIIFVIIYVLANIILWKNIHAKRLHTGLRKIIDYGGLSVIYIFTIISISLNSITSLQTFHTFSDSITNLITKVPFWIILIIPIIALLLTNKNDANY
jgi:hypothetical protein